MLVALTPLFAIGLPQSQPGDYAHVLKWPMVLFFVMSVLFVSYGYWVSKKRKLESESQSQPVSPAATTKACSYCGRDNDAEATHCCECGTAFLAQELDQNTSKQEPFTA